MERMPVDFTAIDFETANRSPASACAVGVVKVRDGAVVAREGWLIRPPAGHDAFEPFNVQLHGVSKERVARAHTWEAQLPRLLDAIGGDVVVAHNAPFDLGVFAAACLATAELMPSAPPPLEGLCSLRLARRVYELPRYRLPVAAEAAGFTELVHHDPVSDAEGAAAIVVDCARRLEAADVRDLAAKGGVRLRELDLAARREEALALVEGARF
ncbi:Putative bifunctional exonuclease/endonuclease protein [Pseudoclavibacter triregionum]|nr:Putative bifunctional exonuclease/endonuclease protein [Pseudoclavibacter triregionum]